MKIINFKKKIMKLFRKAQQKLYENAKLCYIYKKKKKNVKINISNIRKFVKLEIIVTIQKNIEVLYIAYMN